MPAPLRLDSLVGAPDGDPGDVKAKASAQDTVTPSGATRRIVQVPLSEGLSTTFSAMPNMSNVNPRHYQPPQQQGKAESIQYFGQPQAQVIRGRTTVASFGTPQQHHTLNISSPPPQTIISSPPQAVVSSPPLARAPKLPIYPLAKEGIPLQQLPALEKLAPLQQFSLQMNQTCVPPVEYKAYKQVAESASVAQNMPLCPRAPRSIQVSSGTLKRPRLSSLSESVAHVTTKMSYLRAAMASFQSDPNRYRLDKVLSWFYSERKIIFFFVMHFFATMAVWQHFAHSKFKVQEAKVPEGANLFWWKRLTPTVEFGAMHAILLQMSLLPLTMARYSIAFLSETFVAKFVPFQRVTAMHIHLGYTMVFIVFFATVLFFTFFGQGCVQQKSGLEPLDPNGKMNFCELMTSEIMNTGYGILAILLIIGATSYLRNVIPYEVFYVTHHLVFVMFFIAIAHTFDDKARAGQSRSQNFKWFTASLIWYLSDRAFMVYNTETAPVVEWKALSGDDDGDDSKGRMLIVRLKRPAHWKFQPGQFVSICASSLLGDYSWHPFSIGSSSTDPTLDLYIQVQAPGSWTDRLWHVARTRPLKMDLSNFLLPTLKMQGPFGAALASWNDYGHVIAVGSGTGVVPMMSLLKSTYSRLVKVNAEIDAKSIVETEEACGEYASAVARRQLSLVQQVLRIPCLRTLFQRDNSVQTAVNARDDAEKIQANLVKFQLHWRRRRLREDAHRCATYRALANAKAFGLTRQAARVCLLALPVLEFIMATLAVSWSVLHIMQADVKTPKGVVTVTMQGDVVTKLHEQVLLVLHILAVASFGFFWSLCVPTQIVMWWSDAIILGISVLVTILWEQSKSWGHFTALQQLALVVLALYRFARVWMYAALPEDLAGRAIRKESGRLDTFKLIFVTRSATFVEHLWPELDRSWSQLEASWGPEYASRVSKIMVFCTDREQGACERLEAQVKGTALYRAGALRFERPNFSQVLSDHLLGRAFRAQISSGRYPASTSTIVAFTGGTGLGNYINSSVQDAVAGVKMLQQGNWSSSRTSVTHSMEFVQENYGISTPGAQKIDRRLDPGWDLMSGYGRSVHGRRGSMVPYPGESEAGVSISGGLVFKV